MQTKGKRNEYFDILKGATIILVVLGHCIVLGSGKEYYENSLYLDNWLHKIIYSFHMPTFMLISGFFFYYTIQKYTAIQIVKNRITSLLIPIIVWQMLYVTILTIIDNGSFTAHTYINHSYFNALWFLWSVLWNSFIVLIIHHFFKDNLFVYSMLLIATLFLPNKFHIHQFVFMYPYFLCGYFINKIHNTDSKFVLSLVSTKLSLLVFPIYILMIAIYEKQHYVEISGTCILLYDQISFYMIKTDIFRWIIGIVGSACFCVLIAYLSKSTFTQVKGLLQYLGTITLGIYIISDYIFTFFPYLPIHHIHLILIVLETIAVTTISVLLIVIIKKNKYTNKYLLGGR